MDEPTAARISITRGCFFAWLAIATTMVALSFDFDLALRSGAVGRALIAAVLMMKRATSRRSHVRRREARSILSARRGHISPGMEARLHAALDATYLRHAGYAVTAAGAFELLDLTLRFH
jgi:membrane protein implicated in regulation of membrane protease activity